MEIYELVFEMKVLERRLTLYEEKYGVLSEDFYDALMAGKFERYDAFDGLSVAFFEKWTFNLPMNEGWSRWYVFEANVN